MSTIGGSDQYAQEAPMKASFLRLLWLYRWHVAALVFGPILAVDIGLSSLLAPRIDRAAQIRESQAKIWLAGLYTIEKKFYLDHMRYSTSWKELEPLLGEYRGALSPQSSYYVYGFSKNCAAAADESNLYPGNWSNLLAEPSKRLLPDIERSFAGLPCKDPKSGFVLIASGSADAQSVDTWTIDEKKTLVKVAPSTPEDAGSRFLLLVIRWLFIALVALSWPLWVLTRPTAANDRAVLVGILVVSGLLGAFVGFVPLVNY